MIEILSITDVCDGCDVRCLIDDEEVRVVHFAEGRPADIPASVEAVIAGLALVEPEWISVEES